jgi:hypothetical protein
MWIRDISCRSASGPQAINSQPFEQPLQPLESAVVRELLSVAGAAGPEIPKVSGETRPLGIPTVADRIAQEVARRKFYAGAAVSECQMSRAGELLERKQGLLDRMQKEPGAIERTEIEQALKAINEALNRLESEQLDAPVPHH